MEEFTNNEIVNQETVNQGFANQEAGMMEERPARLPRNYDHLVAGIVLTALFSVLGLPVLINACKARLRWKHKNYDLALASARKSKRWIAPCIIIGVIFWVAFFALCFWIAFSAVSDISNSVY